VKKTKKLQLENFQIKSFVTGMKGINPRTVKGGRATIGAYDTDCCPPPTIGAYDTDCCPPPTIGAYDTDCCPPLTIGAYDTDCC